MSTVNPATGLDHTLQDVRLQMRTHALTICLANHGVSTVTARVFTKCFTQECVRSGGNANFATFLCVGYSTSEVNPSLTRGAIQSFRVQLSTALAMCSDEVENVRSYLI